MKTLSELKDDISMQYGMLLNEFDSAELDLILTYVLSTFANDFPEIKFSAYKLGDLSNKRIYFDEFGDDFQEVRYTFLINSLSATSSMFYTSIYNVDDPIVSITEMSGIQLASQYMNSTGLYANFNKPMTMVDSTGEYFNITKDTLVIFSNNRIVNPNSIPEYIYSVLRAYANFKFIDVLMSNQFGNMMDINKKVFDLMYDAVQNDITSGEIDTLSSVSLSSLSISFNNKLNNYSSMLSSLTGNFNNRNFLDELNKQKDEWRQKFRRKKQLFFNYIL